LSHAAAVTAEPADAAPAMTVVSLADRIDGRTREAKLRAVYERTLIQGCGGSPTDVQRLLIDKAVGLLIRADALDRRNNHLVYALLVDTFALILLQLTGKAPGKRRPGPGEVGKTVIAEMARELAQDRSRQ
jgi:hypothetical protein